MRTRSVLPDTRGLFLRALDQGRGIDVGRKIATRQEDAIRNITGSFPACVEDQYLPNPTGAFYMQGGCYEAEGRGKWGNWLLRFDASRVVDVANEVRPKNMAFPVYIKY